MIVLVTSGVAAAEGCCSNFQSSALLAVPLLLSSLTKNGYCHAKYGGIGPDLTLFAIKNGSKYMLF